MRHCRCRRWSLSLLCIAFILVSVSCIEYLNYHQKTYLMSAMQKKAEEKVSLVRTRLEALIFSDVYILNSIPVLMAANPNMSVNDWYDLANRLSERSKHIRSISLAPNDIVEYVYPLEGNMQVLGTHYRHLPEQYQSIEKARLTQDFDISGPIPLLQGGQGVIARIPIFTDPPFNSQYWGSCSVVLDLDTLLEDAGVGALTEQYQIVISSVNELGATGQTFFGESVTLSHAVVKENVYFPFGHWVIAIAEKPTSLLSVNSMQSHSVRLIGYGNLLFLSLSFIAIYRMYHLANQRSLHDPLTGLPNRRYFMSTLEQQFLLAKSAIVGERFALLNIDLDKFKWVNDQFGHNAGDQVLLAAAHRIKSTLRSSDVIARVGGDEFLVLLPRVLNAADAQLIVEAIERSLSHTPVEYGGHSIQVQASIGCALFKQPFNSVEEMLKAADDSMYQAKKQRRDLQIAII